MSFLQVQAEQPTLQPETVFNIGDFPVTNAMLLMWVMTIVLIFVAKKIKNKAQANIKGSFMHLAEMTYEAMKGLLQNLTGNEKMTRRIFPLVGALFIFVGFGNLIGLTPIINGITYKGVGMFRTPTDDFNVTFSLALAMVLLTQIISIKDWGVFGHIGKYIKVKEVVLGFKKGIGAGFMSLIDLFIGLTDIIAEIARVISLSLRLFGNMYAGDFLTVILLGALAYGLPSVWLAMNLLVAVVQAMIFGSLTTIYYVMARKEMEAE